MIRVLIIDDSRSMRALLKQALSVEPDIEVVGEAEDALQAREAIKSLSPDIITLDINMPKMSGLDFLERLMRLRPMPALIISSWGKDYEDTVKSLGGVGVVAKPAPGCPIFPDLADRIRHAVGAPSIPPTDASDDDYFVPNNRFIAIGSSTGGVEALLEIFSKFPKNCPPTVVTQHMPAGFTTSFSSRLDRYCRPRVREASSGAVLEAGSIYIAPGSSAHLEVVGGRKPMCRLVDGPLICGHRPSVDALFQSVSRFGGRAVGVILTGMGSDGAEGLLQMRSAGATTFAQDRKTSLVYGMPRAAAECGAVGDVLPLQKIAPALLSACKAAQTEG